MRFELRKPIKAAFLLMVLVCFSCLSARALLGAPQYLSVLMLKLEVQYQMSFSADN